MLPRFMRCGRMAILPTKGVFPIAPTNPLTGPVVKDRAALRVEWVALESISLRYLGNTMERGGQTSSHNAVFGPSPISDFQDHALWNSGEARHSLILSDQRLDRVNGHVGVFTVSLPNSTIHSSALVRAFMLLGSNVRIHRKALD